jgi:hypothetical protein
MTVTNHSEELIIDYNDIPRQHAVIIWKRIL